MCVSVSSNYKDNYNLKSKPALSFRFTAAPDSIRAFTRDKFPLLAAKWSWLSPLAFLLLIPAVFISVNLPSKTEYSFLPSADYYEGS